MTKREEIKKLQAWIQKESDEWKKIHLVSYQRFVARLPQHAESKTLARRAERLSQAHAALGELAL